MNTKLTGPVAARSDRPMHLRVTVAALAAAGVLSSACGAAGRP